ncbi:MAG TPA: hypothetical protein VK179_11570 [Bacteroidales bacterium]|nr:hypothetical protein [Bacteroidales bacterium]
MRVLLIIAFLSAVKICTGQEISEKVVTLNDLLNTAYRNLSVTSTDSIIRNNQQQIKSTWHSLLYLIIRHNELENYCNEFSDIGRVAELRYKAGESDFQESMDQLAMVAGYNTEKDITANEISICRNLLRQQAGTDYTMIPADTALNLYEIDKSHGSAKILPDSNDVFSALTLENMSLQLDNLFIKLNYYTGFGLDYAESISRTAHARFHQEDIDLYAFLKAITESLKIKLQYLECLNNYNQSAIQLEYYAY